MLEDELRRPDEKKYSTIEILELLVLAEKQGHLLGKGSYLTDMTIGQLDDLVHGRSDA